MTADRLSLELGNYDDHTKFSPFAPVSSGAYNSAFGRRWPASHPVLLYGFGRSVHAWFSCFIVLISTSFVLAPTPPPTPHPGAKQFNT